MAMPPSTLMQWPVMYEGALVEGKVLHEACNLLRLAEAARRMFFITPSTISAGSSAVMSDSIKPGATALTVMPRGANSRAMVIVIAITPPLAAA